MQIERNGELIELSPQELEIAYREKEAAYTEEDALRHVKIWLENEDKSESDIADFGKIPIGSFANEFLKRYNEDVKAYYLWQSIVSKYFDNHPEVFKTAEERGLRTFTFTAIEQFSETFDVEARNVDEAAEKAEEMLRSGAVECNEMSDSWLYLEPEGEENEECDD